MQELTLGRSLRLAAQADPDGVAIRFNGSTVSHGEFDAWSNRVAHGLRAFGLAKGDRMGVMLPNSPLYLAVAAAAAKSGIVLITLNYRFTGAEIAYHLGDAQAAALIFDASFRPAVEAAYGALPGLRRIVQGSAQPGEMALDDLSAGQPEEAVQADVREADTLLLQYTSGTTGRPKGAIITHRNRSLAFLHWPVIYDVGRDDVLLHTGPFHHSAPFGMALCQLCLGGSVVIMPAFRPEAALSLIERERVSWAFMVPTMLTQIIEQTGRDAPRPDVSSLRRVLSGGAALPTVVKERVMAIFPEAGLYEFYGATEAGTITVLLPQDQRRKTRCVGRPVFGSEVVLLDAQRQPVAPGAVGEIFMRTPSLFDGYYNAPDKTAQAFHDGWCTLGDLGRLDEEGFLYIVDRVKDVIKSGGVNVYPSEIEEVLLTHPDVVEVAVVGIPHARWGEAVHAIVVTRSGAPLTHEALVRHCAGQLADYKTPKSVETRAELPHSPAGKILKRSLRDPFWAQAAQKV